MAVFRTALTLSLLLFVSLGTHGLAEEGARINPKSKITFDFEPLNEQGLYGPPDGLRALHYEFCIPADPGLAAQVRQIDPTVRIYKTSPGRIGCTEEEYLCIGNTHQPNFKTVLLNLAQLPQVKRIDQAFFE